jgi:tRNA threonylcarbamoyladenosine biosynthesis protein TsaE
MGEDTRAADARRIGEAGFRAGRAAARRAAGDPGEARPAGGSVGPFELDEAALAAWGERIGAQIATPVFLALRGDLGAGKSVLARAIARGAGVSAAMPSPTFNLLFEYETGGTRVSHLDLYRLEDPEEVWELGWRDLGEGDQIVLVEWPERAEALLPEPRWDIYLEPVAGDALRRSVRLEAAGRPPVIPTPEKP